MKVISFTVYELLNGAHADYYFTLIQQAKKCEAIVANIKAELDALEAAYNVEDEIMLRIRKNELTDKIADQDALRDRLLSLISYVAKTSCKLRGEGVAEAAASLVHVLDAYGNVQTMQYDRETGMIRNLCQDLQGRYAPQVATLKLAEAVENLRAANEEFNQLIVDRDESNAGFLKNELAAARKDSDAAYYQFIEVLNSLSVLTVRQHGAANNPYRPFVEWLNAYIERLKREALKQHVTAESAEPTEPSQPGIENPADGTDPDYPTEPGEGTTPNPGEGENGSTGSGSTGGNGAEEHDYEYVNPDNLDPAQNVTIEWLTKYKGTPIKKMVLPLDGQITQDDIPDCPTAGYEWNHGVQDINRLISNNSGPGKVISNYPYDPNDMGVRK